MTSTQAVVICVDMSQCRNAGIMGAEVEQFVAIVLKFMSLRQLGWYDGYECLSEETRIHLFSWDAPALAAGHPARSQSASRLQVHDRSDQRRRAWW